MFRGMYQSLSCTYHEALKEEEEKLHTLLNVKFDEAAVLYCINVTNLIRFMIISVKSQLLSLEGLDQKLFSVLIPFTLYASNAFQLPTRQRKPEKVPGDRSQRKGKMMFSTIFRGSERHSHITMQHHISR